MLSTVLYVQTKIDAGNIGFDQKECSNSYKNKNNTKTATTNFNFL